MRNINIFSLILVLCFLVACDSGKNKTDHSQHTQTEKSKTTAKSPPKTAMANIGNVHVHMEYNAPLVRNRIIWGGLVPYGEVWVTGAHTATSINFNGNVEIAGQTIPKGKYAFFTIPDKEKWTLILNKNWDQHLTDEYEPKDDVLRWTVKPDTDVHTEALTYQVTGGEEKGTIEFRWEKIKVSFDIIAAE